MKKLIPDFEKIKYLTQRDNINPHSTCFPASVCMSLSYSLQYKLTNSFDNYIIKKILEKNDEHKNYLRRKFGKWTLRFMPYQVFAFWVRFIPNNFLGLSAKYLSKDIEKYKQILETRPLVVSTKLTKSGHIVVLVGYDTIKKGFYILDPYGKKPYKTKSEKNYSKPYFVSGYSWLKNHSLDIYRV